MDINLKRLRRSQLIGLAEDLLEAYENQAVEIQRLKQELTTYRLPRSAKVGSLAEASLLVNGYFDAAQKSADTYLREIKRLRDQLALRTEGAVVDQRVVDSLESAKEAERRAQEHYRDAQLQADRIIAQANAEAEQIIARAQTRAAQITAEADDARTTVPSVRQQPSGQSVSQSTVATSRRSGRRTDVTLPEVHSQNQQAAWSSATTGELAGRKASASQPRERQVDDQQVPLSSATTGDLLASRARHSHKTVNQRMG